MVSVVKNGKPGTAMMKFSNTLNAQEIEAVVHFVRTAFMQQKIKNTQYHTVENGWENHEQYIEAFPFATGDLPLDTPWENLNESQRKGKQLFLASCISCHDRASVDGEGAIWESFPLSWPRNGVTPQNLHDDSFDSISQASPYALHDNDEGLAKTPEQKHGEGLFIENCSFCHALDGTGKNWIGQFIEPHPRNFAQLPIADSFTREELILRIKNGVAGTAMPAWGYVLTDAEISDLADYLMHRFK